MIPPFALRVCIGALLLGALCEIASAQSTLIPLPTRRDMVFDHSGNYLYISTTDGWVRRYNTATGQVDAGYNLGGSLNGLDIAPNDSFLLVAQNVAGTSTGTFHRVGLPSGTVTNINYPLAPLEAGAFDVRIGTNGIALATTRAQNGTVPLRQIDLATNTISVRADAPGSGSGGTVAPGTSLVRDPAGTRILALEGRLFTYNAETNTFGPSAQNGRGCSSAALNRTGTLMALKYYDWASFDSVPAFNFVYSMRAHDRGVAFDGVSNKFYGAVSTAGQIRVYDSTTFTELYRLPIGESISAEMYPFDIGRMTVSNDGRFLALSTPSGIRVFTLPANGVPPPPPVFGTARDMIFDSTGQNLYFTTDEGLVWRYNIATATFGTPYNLGGSLLGADLTPDGQYLVVAQHLGGATQGVFQKLRLSTGEITNLIYPQEYPEAFAYDISIGSNGIGLATSDYAGSAWVPLRQIDLTTDSVTVRTDAPGSGFQGQIRNRSQIRRSADRSRLYLLEADHSSGPRFTYSTLSNSFGPSSQTQTFHGQGGAAVSRHGDAVATFIFSEGARLESAPAFAQLHTFPTLNGGLVFDATRDLVYGTSVPASSFNSQIIAYDTTTYAEKFRFDVGEVLNSGASRFGPGLLVASPDGQRLAVRTNNDTRIFSIPGVQLVSVASSKMHGAAEFSVPLPLDPPRAVESRSGGAAGAYTMVFLFGEDLVSVGGATVTSGIGTVASGSIDPGNRRRYIVNLASVANQQYLKVTLNDVIGAAGGRTGLISQQMGILIGDTNGNYTVNVGDATQTRSRSGQSVDAITFRSDINGDGTINAADALLVRANSGRSLSQ